MKLKLNLSTLVLLLALACFAYALPLEMALFMAGEATAYVELMAAIYLLSRTSPGGRLLALAKGLAAEAWVRLQIYMGEALVRNVPAPAPR